LDESAFGVSNLGLFGVDQFLEVIHPMQSAIAAIGRSRKVVVPSETGPLSLTFITLSLSCDGRLVDETIASAFLDSISARLSDSLQLSTLL